MQNPHKSPEIKAADQLLHTQTVYAVYVQTDS